MEVSYDQATSIVSLSWHQTIGLFYKLESSSDFTTWTDLTGFVRAEDSQGSFGEEVVAPARSYFRIVRNSTGP